MRLAVLKERRPAETRVAATPETVKRLIGLGLVTSGNGLGVGHHRGDVTVAAPQTVEGLARLGAIG